MSIWGDITLFNDEGVLIAIVKIQDEWSGDIKRVYRTVRSKDGHYYCKADNKEICLDREVARLKEYTARVKYSLAKVKEYNL